MDMYPGGNIVRVTPTVVEDSAYADGDVLFVGTEVPNAVSSRGGVSRLVNAYLIDEDSQDTSINLILTQKSVDFGTIDATANVSFDNAIASDIIGVVEFSNSYNTSDIDNMCVYQMAGLGGASESPRPLLVQADGGSRSIYVNGVIFNGTPTFTNTDSIQIVFHFEYLG